MCKVNILLSAYNGQDYIEQQIESLLSQTYNDCQIFIRDDGSTDNTREILKKYKNLENINVIYGENVGFLKSFKILLENAVQGDYWAFCDQDDIWYEDKIEKAVQWFQKKDNTIPILYHCSYYIVDKDLNIMSEYTPVIKNYTFKRAITENIYSGFASVINSKLREMMLRGNWAEIGYHDCWMTLIAMSMGECYFDNYIGAEHRRLDSSISEEKLYKRINWALQSMFSESPLKKRNIEFYKEFKNELDIDNQKIMQMFISEKYDIRIILKKVVNVSRWRSRWSSELVIRFLMLLNKI